MICTFLQYPLNVDERKRKNKSTENFSLPHRAFSRIQILFKKISNKTVRLCTVVKQYAML